MVITSMTVPFRTDEKVILERIIRNALLDMIDAYIQVATGKFPFDLTIEDRVRMVFGGFLASDYYMIDDKLIFLSLPDNIPKYITMKEFASIIGGSYVEGYNYVYVPFDAFIAFMKRDYDTIKGAMGT
jgi:hypothetical protein